MGACNPGLDQSFETDVPVVSCFNQKSFRVWRIIICWGALHLGRISSYSNLQYPRYKDILVFKDTSAGPAVINLLCATPRYPFVR
jgi:hypothetical protein